MQAKSLRPDLIAYLSKRGLLRKFHKQHALLLLNFHHPSLHTELLEPKHLRIYSFRIDRQYRAIFILVSADTFEIIDINNHYK